MSDTNELADRLERIATSTDLTDEAAAELREQEAEVERLRAMLYAEDGIVEEVRRYLHQLDATGEATSDRLRRALAAFGEKGT